MNVTAKRMIIMLVVVGVVFGLLGGFQVFKGIMIKKYMGGGQPPQTVSSVVVKFDEWQPSLSAIGSLRAVRGADLALEVSGIVDEINFNSGDEVKAGIVLMRLRAEDDEAKLRSMEANAQLAGTTYERNLKQYEAKAISRAALDVDASNLKTTQAAVAEQRAVVNKKILKAPFTGRLGVRSVDVGQYLNPGTTVVTLQALDPIFADFYLPPQQVSRLDVGQKVTVKTDSDAPGGLDGQISAINPKVDLNTRTVLVRATLANTEHKLLPGTSVSIEINAGTAKRYLTLPQTAITYNPYGDTVYLVVENGQDEKGAPKLEARQAFIVTGPTRGDQVAVLEGIKEGDVVVSSGQMKIQNGARVLVNNSVQPASDPNPKPVDE